MKNKQYILVMAIFSIILFFFIILWGNFLIKKKYIVECFVDTGSPDTSHNVDLPINTTYSCKNMCGPQSRCYLTGEQCTSDVDCPGCLPTTKHIDNYKVTENVAGNNDSGKLFSSLMPSYSILTTDITRESEWIDPNLINSNPPSYNQGVNIWKNTFDFNQKLFNERYDPNGLQYKPTYPQRSTLSGEFNDIGPLPSNTIFD